MQIPRFTPFHTIALSVSVIPALLWAASLDLDQDGMSDAWELLHNAKTLDPAADEDGDGVTNLAESLAGTDPHDASSYFFISDYQVTDDGILVSFDTILGKEYLIQVSSDLSSWNDNNIWRKGDGQRMNVLIDKDLKAFTPGIITREWFDLADSSGWGLGRLRASTNYLSNTPTELLDLQEFSFPEFNPDRDQHGSRIRCYLIPPVTGEYRFLVASDDQSELMLSPNSNPEEKAVIAFIDGWTSPGELDKYPEQISEFITLQAGQIYYMELEQFEGGGGDHASVSWEGPGITLETISAEHLATYDPAADTYLPQNTAFFQAITRDYDTDQDGANDYDELVLQTNRYSASSGSLSALSSALADTNRLSISTVDTAAYESGPTPGHFLIKRNGNLNPITASISLSGSASAADYESVDTSVTFPLGIREALISITPIDDGLLENDESITLSIMPSTDYEISGNSSASLMIEDSPPELLISRPSPPTNTASIGQALVRFWERGNRTSARVSIDYSNLSSPQTSSTIVIVSPDGNTQTPVLTLPAGKIIDHFWDYGSNQSSITTALDAGRLHVVINTVANPDGELIAPIISQQADASSFTTPASPPAVGTGAITEAAAARFLSQTTFGSTPQSIADLVTLNSYEDWIDAQMNETTTPPTLHYPTLLAQVTEDSNPGRNERIDQWYHAVITENDQLRQRVAFALSEIFVVSDEDGTLNGNQLGLTNYYDLLVTSAFGNYRTLIEDISKSPIMGQYLSHLRNRKANPFLGTNPDENYAREIMQLFSIGLVMLHPDGSPILGEDGVPIPTYDQATISEMARVFTGWIFQPEDLENISFRYGRHDFINPMFNYADEHDTEPKTVVAGLQLPGAQTGEEELDAVLDTLFNHPNTGPFISKLLIQRLVTSNPSPGYIYRVANVFADDGTGTRGNFGAVIKAILLDYEARSSDLTDIAGYGKPQEPLMKFCRVLRSFNFSKNTSGNFGIYYQRDTFGQAVLRSPTVFNFFLPSHSPQGLLNEAGLLAPEFQIIGETTLLRATNRLYDALDFDGLFGYDPARHINFDWQPYLDMVANDPNDYIDFLDLYFLSGQMPASMRAELLDLFATLNFWDVDRRELYRVVSAAQIVINSPQAAIIK